MVELPLVEPGNWLEEPNKFFDDYCRGRKIIRKVKRERESQIRHFTNCFTAHNINKGNSTVPIWVPYF